MENKTINTIDIKTLKTLIEAYTDVQKPKTQWQKGVYTLFDFLISSDMVEYNNRDIKGNKFTEGGPTNKKGKNSSSAKTLNLGETVTPE